VDFGSVSLCHVAAGRTEAVIEFAKGFAVWDLAPGHYILHASGGAVLDLDGKPVPLDYHSESFAKVAKAMDRRQRFVAAGSVDLAHEIMEAPVRYGPVSRIRRSAVGGWCHDYSRTRASCELLSRGGPALKLEGVRPPPSRTSVDPGSELSGDKHDPAGRVHVRLRFVDPQ